ncbi:MAG: hypothetical protein AAF629_21160 [Chloroflexota bacterium]
MSYWESLSQEIKKTIQQERIGTLVFVRGTLILSAKAEKDCGLVGALLAEVSHWFSIAPHQLYATGQTDTDVVSVSLEFPTGATALISMAFGQAQSHIDLSVIGNLGAAYHRENLNWLDEPQVPDTLPALAQSLAKAVSESLTTGNSKIIESETVS